MSISLFEWDRYVGTGMTPVDAMQNARAAGQTIEEYAQAYAAEHASEEISADELANGMAGNMLQAARNLAHFRVVGNPDLSPHEAAIFRNEPADLENYYLWIETAGESEIVERITSKETE